MSRLMNKIIRNLKIKIKKRRYLKSDIRMVDNLTGEEFEEFLLVHFKKLGYKGKLTPLTADYGADLILKKDGETTVVQAKRYKSKIGIAAVQQILGAKSYYNADNMIVATNSYFTPNAINLADSAGVTLYDRDFIKKLIKDEKETLFEVAGSDIKDRHICKKCGAVMKLRKGKYGDFYGCSNYPKCTYTERID